MGNKKLGIIELRPRREFYDYKAKYDSKSKTEHIIPVDLSKKNLKRVLNIAFKAHKIFPAMIKGFIPLSIKGHFDISVTDVLINEEGIVEDVFYAKKDVADHYPFDVIKEFSLR